MKIWRLWEHNVTDVPTSHCYCFRLFVITCMAFRQVSCIPGNGFTSVVGTSMPLMDNSSAIFQVMTKGRRTPKLFF